DDLVITGANVENVAYGSTICAERMAIGRANAMGKRIFKSMAIIARGENTDHKKVTGPCGACRQMIFEFSCLSGKDIEIIMSNTRKDKIIISTIRELLPMAFGPVGLGVSIEEYVN
ncbi:MAG: cytidine deaminase, partial [Candidatus Thermoplasmatota archaeon]|nr:cytidine deaminase [Candidatus Thermoplasmatota archaeon]